MASLSAVLPLVPQCRYKCPTCGLPASNGLSAQAITEEVKACQPISNDQQRLKCFDSLFANKPNQHANRRTGHGELDRPTEATSL